MAAQLNHFVLTGVITDEPVPDIDRQGNPVILLTVAFAAPDVPAEEDLVLASTEIEIPADVAERSGELRTGVSIFASGQQSGGGGLLARLVVTESASGSSEL